MIGLIDAKERADVGERMLADVDGPAFFNALRSRT